MVRAKKLADEEGVDAKVEAIKEYNKIVFEHNSNQALCAYFRLSVTLVHLVGDGAKNDPWPAIAKVCWSLRRGMLDLAKHSHTGKLMYHYARLLYGMRHGPDRK